jgi:hypothetical protein
MRRSDTGCVPGSGPNPSRPDGLVASIDALAEQTSRLVINAATDAARALDEGRPDVAVEHAGRLAAGAAVSAGEMAWLAAEFQAAGPDAVQREAAGEAIAAMSHAAGSAAAVVQSLADESASAQIAATAETLRRVASQLLALLQPLGLSPPPG